jgi:hypothetical protein
LSFPYIQLSLEKLIGLVFLKSHDKNNFILKVIQLFQSDFRADNLYYKRLEKEK